MTYSANSLRGNSTRVTHGLNSDLKYRGGQQMGSNADACIYWQVLIRSLEDIRRMRLGDTLNILHKFCYVESQVQLRFHGHVLYWDGVRNREGGRLTV
jgi:hypothetical protein